MLQGMTAAGHFDMIKLDIEGEEKALLWDPPSVAALCRATCIAIEVHDRAAPGASKAFDRLLRGGCRAGAGARFARQGSFGDYELACKDAGRGALQQGSFGDAAEAH